MKEYTEEDCPKCGQRLRFPKNVGGIVMKCPNCGQRFHSDFRIGSVNGESRKYAVSSNMVVHLFELPGQLLARLLKKFR